MGGQGRRRARARRRRLPRLALPREHPQDAVGDGCAQPELEALVLPGPGPVDSGPKLLQLHTGGAPPHVQMELPSWTLWPEQPGHGWPGSGVPAHVVPPCPPVPPALPPCPPVPPALPPLPPALPVLPPCPRVVPRPPGAGRRAARRGRRRSDEGGKKNERRTLHAAHGQHVPCRRCREGATPPRAAAHPRGDTIPASRRGTARRTGTST